MDNAKRLTAHLDGCFRQLARDWADAPGEAGGYRRQCLDKWRATIHAIVLNDPRFLGIAEPFTAATVIDPGQYYMRADGSLVFVEVVLADDRGELIGGHPLRFPYDAAAAGDYYSNELEPDIFGLPMKCVVRVLHNGRKNYAMQTEECLRIIRYQAQSRYPILPLAFHRETVGGDELHIVQTPIFRRSDFVAYFPFRRAHGYMYRTLKFEPIVRGTDWLLNESHLLDFARHDPLRLTAIGVTGSSAFGDINDREDFDVVFLDTLEKLQAIRDFIYAGVREGAFNSVSPVRPLRISHPGIPIASNDNKPLILCTFQNLADVRQDPLHGARFSIRGRVRRLIATVVDDSGNMLTPPRVTLAGIRVEDAPGQWDLPDGTLLAPMVGNCRGAYRAGMRIAARDILVVDFTPRQGAPFTALAAVGWYDIDIIGA